MVNDFSKKIVFSTFIYYDHAWYKYLFDHFFSRVGAHIGHSVKNTIRQAGWMIYGYKWDLSIINLSKTIYAIKSAFVFICRASVKAKSIWFISQDKIFSKYIRYLAIKCGEFSSTFYWIRGLISNYIMISSFFFLRRPNSVFMRKDWLLDFTYSDWFFTKLRIPGCIFISSIYANMFQTKEAYQARIGCIGLVDTNTNSKICTLAIPANDDSLDWIVFIHDIFSEYILYKKLGMLLRWYYYIIVRRQRLSYFEKWMLYRIDKKGLQFSHNRIFSKNWGKYSIFYFPIWFISSFNSKFFPIIDKIFNRSDFNDKFVVLKKFFNVLFDNIVFGKRLLSVSLVKHWVKRPLFLDLISIGFWNESTLAFSNPYRFKYKLGSWIVFSRTYRFNKYDRSTLKKILSIYNISFLGGFLNSFFLQKLYLIFGSSSKYIYNWWEKLSYLLLFGRKKVARLWLYTAKGYRKSTNFSQSEIYLYRFFLWESNPLFSKFKESHKNKNIKLHEPELLPKEFPSTINKKHKFSIKNYVHL